MGEGEEVDSYLSQGDLRVSKYNEPKRNWNSALRFQAYCTYYSQIVTHLGINQTRRCLISVIVWEPVFQRDVAASLVDGYIRNYFLILSNKILLFNSAVKQGSARPFSQTI